LLLHKGKWLWRGITWREPNATNMYTMNAKCERESDPNNFVARITKFGVVVGKIWRYKVLALFCEFF
jgi:hypothetical protein